MSSGMQIFMNGKPESLANCTATAVVPACGGPSIKTATTPCSAQTRNTIMSIQKKRTLGIYQNHYGLTESKSAPVRVRHRQQRPTR